MSFVGILKILLQAHWTSNAATNLLSYTDTFLFLFSNCYYPSFHSLSLSLSLFISFSTTLPFSSTSSFSSVFFLAAPFPYFASSLFFCVFLQILRGARSVRRQKFVTCHSIKIKQSKLILLQRHNANKNYNIQMIIVLLMLILTQFRHLVHFLYISTPYLRSLSPDFYAYASLFSIPFC